jgi:hypothetical protein
VGGGVNITQAEGLDAPGGVRRVRRKACRGIGVRRELVKAGGGDPRQVLPNAFSGARTTDRASDGEFLGLGKDRSFTARLLGGEKLRMGVVG